MDLIISQFPQSGTFVNDEWKHTYAQFQREWMGDIRDITKFQKLSEQPRINKINEQFYSEVEYTSCELYLQINNYEDVFTECLIWK